MVYSYNIVKPRIMCKAFFPPVVAVGFHSVPVIYRVAPKLTRFREDIRRYARHLRGGHIAPQLKQIGVAPYVCAVQLNVKRNIADYFNSRGICVIFKLHILLKKEILNNFAYSNFFRMGGFKGFQGVRQTVFNAVVKL